jgi:hypothetical protein
MEWSGYCIITFETYCPVVITLKSTMNFNRGATESYPEVYRLANLMFGLSEA